MNKLSKMVLVPIKKLGFGSEELDSSSTIRFSGCTGYLKLSCMTAMRG
jgi:hypothetical protein